MPRLTKATAPSAKQPVAKSAPPPSAPRTPQAAAQRSSVVQEAPSALPPPEQCRPADTDDFDFIESLSQTPAAPRPKAKPAPPRATSKSAKSSVSPRNSSGDVPPPPPASTATEAKPGGRKTAPKSAPAKGSGKKTAPPTPAKGKAKSAAPAPKKATAARAAKRSRSPTECETPPPPPDAPLLSQSMSGGAAGSAGGSPLPYDAAQSQAATQEGADGERSPKLSQVRASQEHRSEGAAASPSPDEGRAGGAVGRLSQEGRPSGPLPPGPDAEYDAALAEISEGTATAALRLQVERYQRFLQQYARKKEAAAVRPARFRYWCNFLDAERDKGNDRAFFGGSSPARKSKGE